MNEENISNQAESEIKGKVIEPGKDPSTSLPKKKNPSKMIFVTGLVLASLFIIAGLTYFFISNPRIENKTNQSDEVVRRSVCDNLELDIRQQYESVVARQDRSQMKDLVGKIESLDEFDKDPNCLIPLVAYNIHMADIEKANQYFKSLNDLYSNDSVFAFFVTEPTIVDSLKLELEGMELRNGNINESVIYY